jgi:hypothetical protein
MENSGLLGEPILLFPLTEGEEVKGFLAHPHFQSLSMKGDSNEGNETAKLCPCVDYLEYPCLNN